MNPLSPIRSVLAATAIAVTLTGCSSDATFGPGQSTAAIGGASSVQAANRAVDLGSCPDLQPPAGSKLVFHAYAEGSQIYRWNGQEWQFNGPSATLYANAGGTGVVGIHYGGPTWEANSGGLIVGALSKRCDVAPADIPWLLLTVARTEGPGIFSRVTHVQRVNTVGGQFPSDDGSVQGELRYVPYTAEYYFYRAP